MVLKVYTAIFMIATTISFHYSLALNFEHVEYDGADLQDSNFIPRQQTTVFRSSVDGTVAENKFEIQMRLGNGVTVGCEVEKRANGYEDITELYLEDEFGRREPEMGEELPHARYRSTHSLFTRHPEATADLLEMEVPYGWWPAECIQRIMGLSFENSLCNCPSGPIGLTGRPGPEGPPGLPGPRGTDGRNGTHGRVGAPGDEGPHGPPGKKGKKGAPGSQGTHGGPGPVGPPGLPGRDGRNGVDGPPGAQGQNGKPGKDGRDGKNGRDGLQGPPGEAGISGEAGVAGIPGEQGLQGIPAPSGVNGVNGNNGLNGDNGHPGDNGACPPPGHPPHHGWDSVQIPFEDAGTPEIIVTSSTDPIPDTHEPSNSETPLPTDNTGGWTPDAGSATPIENEWGATASGDTPEKVPQSTASAAPSHQQQTSASPSPNPNIIPAKPAQAAQTSFQSVSDMPNSKPQFGGNWGSHGPYVPPVPGVPNQFGGRPQPQATNTFANPTQHGQQNMHSFHDKRPDYPVSQSFQGQNPLWSSPQFQANLGMLQQYGGYWKNTGTRSVAPTGTGKGKLCAKNKNKVKSNKRDSEGQQIPVNHARKVDENKNSPPRARVDLDVLEDDQHILV